MKSKVYRSKVGGTPLVVIILLIVIVLMVSVMDIIANGFMVEKVYVHVVDLLLIALLFSFVFNTKYYFDESYIHYTIGPLKGRIKLKFLQSIERAQNKWNIIQPGIHNKGIKLKLNSGLTFFFAPKDETVFVDEIKKRTKNVSIQL